MNKAIQQKPKGNIMSQIIIDLFTDGHTHDSHPHGGGTPMNFAEVFERHNLTFTHQWDGPGGGATVYTVTGTREDLINAINVIYDDNEDMLEETIACSEQDGIW